MLGKLATGCAAAISLLAVFACSRGKECERAAAAVERAISNGSLFEAKQRVASIETACPGDASALVAQLEVAHDKRRNQIAADQTKRDRIAAELESIWKPIDAQRPEDREMSDLLDRHCKAEHLISEAPTRFRSHIERAVRNGFELRKRLIDGTATQEEKDEDAVRRALAKRNTAAFEQADTSRRD